MKTVEALYNEVVGSNELRKEFMEAVKTRETAEAFLKKYDCSASLEEVASFLKSRYESDDEELSTEEVAAVAGGAKQFFDSLGNVVEYIGDAFL